MTPEVAARVLKMTDLAVGDLNRRVTHNTSWDGIVRLTRQFAANTGGLTHADLDEARGMTFGDLVLLAARADLR